MKKLIVIVGPTAVGKTKLSIVLAKYFDGEIVNADSTQIYKDLDIATAKVTKDEMENISHHLLSIKNINESYNVYDYQKDSRKAIDQIIKRGKIPIIVGGTGLYIKSSLYDYKFNEEIDNQIYEKLTNDQLYKKLLEIDPQTNIHKNNRKRVVRAINYYNSTHQPFSLKEKNNNLLYDAIFIGLTTERNILYDRINRRVDQMIDNGLLDEAKGIYDLGIKTKPIMTIIGYKELFPYFEGNGLLGECIDLIKQRSRKYAKRQYTWFNNQLPVNWIKVDFDNFDNTVNAIINLVKKKID